MRTLFTKITLASVALTGIATADAPKPPADIDAMAKNILGTWKCTGTEHAADGSAKPMTGKMIAKLDLDKWWIHDVFEGKGPRGTFKIVAYSTFDAGSKKWRRVSVDSVGHQYVGTSDGMKDGKLTWNMDFLGTMGSGQFKDTVDTTDPKAGVKFSGTMSMDKGKSWKPVYDMTCKKG